MRLHTPTTNAKLLQRPSPGKSEADLGRGGPVRRWAATFWLRHLFWSTRHAPGYARLAKPVWVGFTWFFAAKLRQTTLANARRLLGPASSPRAQRRLARAVIGNFIQFIGEFGHTRHLSRTELRARIESVQGQENFYRCRQMGKGAIVATAHLGSFEIGIAALPEEEKVHVLFRRDAFAHFEAMRQEVHRRLGVIEESVDDGMQVWVRLRDALLKDELVLIQADRVVLGQKGVPVPFLDGHILVPAGPVKLALTTGAPIIPILSHRRPDGRVRLCIEEPIVVDPSEGEFGRPHPALLRLARVIERHVRAHPEQWLMLQPVWLEDQTASEKAH